MSHTIAQLAQLADLKPAIFLAKLREEIGTQVPEVHHWTFETQVEPEQANMIIDWLGLEEPGQLTQNDNAVKQAKLRLVESLKVVTAQAIATQQSQDELLGAASGVNSALGFYSAHLEARQDVFDAFIQESFTGTEQQLAEIDDSMSRLAITATDCLGKAKKGQARTRLLLEQLKGRVQALKKGID